MAGSVTPLDTMPAPVISGVTGTSIPVAMRDFFTGLSAAAAHCGPIDTRHAAAMLATDVKTLTPAGNANLKGTFMGGFNASGL
jgi:hypothetical protein